jgi:hypothetical protein
VRRRPQLQEKREKEMTVKLMLESMDAFIQVCDETTDEILIMAQKIITLRGPSTARL